MTGTPCRSVTCGATRAAAPADRARTVAVGDPRRHCAPDTSRARLRCAWRRLAVLATCRLPCPASRDDVLYERDQNFLARLAPSSVAEHDRHVFVEVEGATYRVGAVRLLAVEAVHRDDMRCAVALEIVQRGIALGEPTCVGEDDGTERPKRQLVPDKVEPFLPRRSEQV